MDKIDELLTRGVDAIYPTKEELEKALRSGKKLKLYQGFDPTGNQLHIGHMVGLRKLRQWQDLGHHVIFLIGDFTAMVGDPSGKISARKMLTKEEVLKNAQFYKEQAGKILRFTGENPIEILYNSDWLGKMSAIDFLKVAGLLSIQQVMERDMFQERQKKGQDVYMNEFLYPVMQAYDSVEMNVDLEIGGSDQMFNMLMGRKLMRHMLHKDKFVMTTPLLTDSEGRKIGKTEGNVIALNDKPEDLYAKIMTLPDDVIIKAHEYLTDEPMESIKQMGNAMRQGENPLKFKKKLAFNITKQLNDQESAERARDIFESHVQKDELPAEIPEFEFSKNISTVVDALVQSGMALSKSDARRLIEQKGISINNEVISDVNAPFEPKDGQIIKVGKHRFVKIKTTN